MKRVASLALTVLLLALVGCTGFRTSGEVYPGRPPSGDDSDQSVALLPDAPQPGASPSQVVEGFIRAGSGPQGDWATAKRFLTETFAEEWDPKTSVTIDRLAARTTTVDAETEDDAEVTMSVTGTGLVDASGTYTPQGGSATALAFSLAMQADGQWRITDAPDGIVLFEEQFRSVYRTASLAFFDPTWQYLVPDVRWYPNVNLAASVARDLVDGPGATWLTGAVRTAFPEEVPLAITAVTSVDGVAQVELDREALPLDALTLGRMQAQLEASMRSINVPAVEMTVDGAPLETQAVSTLPTTVDSLPLVIPDGGSLGLLDGDEVVPIGELTDAVDQLAPVVAVETSPDRTRAAVLTVDGAVGLADEDGGTVLDARAGLVSPTIDTSGAVWSVPAGTPQAVTVFPAEGDPIEVQAAWPDATAITDMQISRDGTRVAAVVEARGHREVWVSGIQRATTGGRIDLGVPYVLALTSGEGVDLAWLDDATIGVLERTIDGEVRLRDQPVGGPGTDLTVPSGVFALAGGNISPRLLAEDGVLYTRQTSSWRRIAEGIDVLGVQQGRP